MTIAVSDTILATTPDDEIIRQLRKRGHKNISLITADSDPDTFASTEALCKKMNTFYESPILKRIHFFKATNGKTIFWGL